MTYGDVQKRRANFGAGLVQITKEAGVVEQKHGVGLWCQNRPEWQITGELCETNFPHSFFDLQLLKTWHACLNRCTQSRYMIH